MLSLNELQQKVSNVMTHDAKQIEMLLKSLQDKELATAILSLIYKRRYFLADQVAKSLRNSKLRSNQVFDFRYETLVK